LGYPSGFLAQGLTGFDKLPDRFVEAPQWAAAPAVTAFTTHYAETSQKTVITREK
jgi:hypothetical protein